MRAHTLACTDTYTCTPCMHAHTHTHTHTISVHIYVCTIYTIYVHTISLHVHTHTHTYMQSHLLTQAHTHTHTPHTCTRTHTHTVPIATQNHSVFGGNMSSGENVTGKVASDFKSHSHQLVFCTALVQGSVPLGMALCPPVFSFLSLQCGSPDSQGTYTTVWLPTSCQCLHVEMYHSIS